MSTRLIVDVLAVVVGAAGILWILASAARTVVVPRPERVWLTTTAFEAARRCSWAIAGRLRPDRRAALLGTFAPAVLLALPLLWSAGLIAFFAAVYWALSSLSATDAVLLSGSSLTTLGFVTAPTVVTRLLAVLEALLGLGIVALMISFLPTVYGTFSRREIAVGRLTTRAGEPPSPVEFIVRLDTIGRLEHVGDRWEEWEDWFVELGETHTTFPALIHFRSVRGQRSWITAAELALDTAALVTATEIVPATGQADTLIRSGYLALRAVADYHLIEPERPPDELDRLSVTRPEFEAMVDRLEAAGVPIQVDRAAAWTAFAGWRINYDRAVVGLRSLVGDAPSHWVGGASWMGPRRDG